MSWLRIGDNAATNPIVLRVRAQLRASKRLVPEQDCGPCEVFGFVSLCASLSAGHGTDYVVSYGTACTVSPARVDRLLDLAVKAGYMRKGKRGTDPEWIIIDDPEFLHMRTTAELAWEAQRKADSGNRALVVAVRLRDGDACRYCARVVRWNDRRSDSGATHDHRVPGQPATYETYVVSCRKCNGLRGNDPEADARVPLLPPPPQPYFSESTLAFLAANQQPARSADAADTGSAGSGIAGSGRVGTGRDRTGRGGSGRDGPGQAGPGRGPTTGRNKRRDGGRRR